MNKLVKIILLGILTILAEGISVSSTLLGFLMSISVVIMELSKLVEKIWHIYTIFSTFLLRD